MYKLLGGSGITRRTVTFMPKRTMVVYRSMRLCSFCNFYHRNSAHFVPYHQLRDVSTTKLVGLHVPVKKKAKTRTKKYAELLEVTDQASSNKRASVQKLNAKDLSILVEQPDITMDKLHKLKGRVLKSELNANAKKNIHTQNSIPEIITPPIIKCSDDPIKGEKASFDDSGGSEEIDTDFLTTTFKTESRELLQDLEEHKKYMQTNVRRTKSFSTNIKRSLGNKYYKEAVLDELVSCMYTYLNSGMITMAHDILMRIRKNISGKAKDYKSTGDLYNILLDAYVEKEDFDKVRYIHNLMKKDGITPNTQTYATLLEYLGKTLSSSDTNSIKEIQAAMAHDSITFDDIFNTVQFKKDQQKHILAALREIQPDYEPAYREQDIDYSCKLLENISDSNKFESPVEGLNMSKQMKDLLKKQIEAETLCEVEVKNIAIAQGDMSHIIQSRQNLNKLEKYWIDVISQSFDRNLNYLREKECKDGNVLMPLHPFLEAIDKRHYINAIMREVRQIAKGPETYSASLAVLHEEVGKYINKRYTIERKMQSGVLSQVENIHMAYIDWYMRPDNRYGLSLCNDRTVWGKIKSEVEKNGVSLDLHNHHWPKEILVEIGKFLYHILLNDIKFKNKTLGARTIPAFYTLFRTKSNYLVEQIKPHPFVTRLYKDVQSDTLSFETDLLPSYAPPRPWISIASGGYLLTKTNFVRIPNFASQPRQKLQATPTKQLFPVLDSLNNLAAVPWKINSPVLDVAIEIFQNGGSDSLSVPKHPSLLPAPPTMDKNETSAVKLAMAKEILQHRRLKMEMYSLWCDCLYRLSLANHFRDKIFWLPHNIDFRGRVYPVPPHLNHLTGDLGRSLLLFAKGKPLGPAGLDWIKIHLVNLTGKKKKCTVMERLDYANKIMDDIIDSAERPLTGRKWWTTSEEPWQTLAGCIEIKNALDYGNVEEYVSTFPIHQDGSCNGLQHYAALGRDTIGAQSVNLAPSKYPGDVYSAVATIVESKRAEDAEKGVEIARVLDGFIQRKVIKQTVMTTVYGVTKYGAKLQIMKQLKDVEGFPKDHLFKAGAYLTEQTFASLRSMFTSAREIQDWLTNCARVIANKHGESVEWVTPLGLPVVQPYFKKPSKTMYMSSRREEKLEKPDTVKQKNAFPPNFIHSLDSTHMMLTSLYCAHRGLTFVSVHDCFWTHAHTVELMNQVCREQFVALHDEPILENLSQYFMQTYLDDRRFGRNSSETLLALKQISEDVFQRVPAKGNFDIKNVLSSVYFFS